MDFEIVRLDDVNGSAVDSTVVDAASVERIVLSAAETGQRLLIRPAEAAIQSEFGNPRGYAA